MSKYKIIYIDPPWSYRDPANAGKRGACHKYQVQSQDWLKKLKIDELADKDCALIIWVTMPKLNEVFELVESWKSFQYKTCLFSWMKTNKKNGNPFIGMGRYSRSNQELCLLFTKGKPKRISASVSSVVISPIEQHSKKPDMIREKIVQLFGDIPRIELFARQQNSGWTCLGNEVDGKDINEAIDEVIKQ